MRPTNPCSECGLKKECKKRNPYVASPKGFTDYDRKKDGKCLKEVKHAQI